MNYYSKLRLIKIVTLTVFWGLPMNEVVAAYNKKLNDLVECRPLDAQMALAAAIEDESYNKAIQPNAPLHIQSTFIVHEIHKVDEIEQLMKIQTTMYQQWTDPRLHLNIPQCMDNLTIPVPRDLYSSLWIPSTRVTNTISATVAEAPAEVKTITSTPTGNLEFRVQLILTLPCKMDYTDFPFDKLSCDMVLATWLPANYINMTWINGYPIKILTSRIKLASYAVGKYDFRDISTPLVGGRWAIIFNLHRFFNYYILNVYIPNGLVVVLAWASFWFAPDGSRGGLCLTCLVSIILQFNGVANSIPKVGYTKGIDLWFLGCLILICITFLEFAVLAFFQNIAGGLDKPMPVKRYCEKFTVRDFSRYIDRFFRLIFILAFVAMVTAYFWIYGKPAPENYGQEEGEH